MNKTFEQYLIMVGIISVEFDMDDNIILNNLTHFLECYDDGISAYKALTILTLIDDNE